MIKRLKFLSTLCCLSLLLTGCSSSTKKEDKTIELNISAAASLKEAMADLEAAYTSKNPEVSFVINYGSSGSLQQQIEQGAACDVFISAGQKQMTALADKDLLLDGTNKTLLTNDLVLVTGEDKEIKDLDTLATDKVEKLAIGDPESVPAGKYAKEVLDNTKLYDKVENKLVLAKDVKEVLSWVQKGSADAGFVYLSDTVGAKGIKVALTTDEDTHSTISYPIAVLKASEKQDKAKAFEDFLLSDDGQTILEKYGFKKAN